MTRRLINVGIGGLGRHGLDFIQKQSEVESVACVDVDEPALEQAAQAFGCTSFTRLDPAPAETEAHAAIIASPSLLHGQHARQALETGMLSMLEQFQEAINGGPEPETSGADNLWTLAMFESAIESTRSGRYVPIEETFPVGLQARAGVSQGLRPLE